MPISLILILLAAAAALGQGFYPRPADLDTSRYLVPEDLSYQGAFRMPAERAGSTEGFNYTVGAMTYSPDGDTAVDGFPGALVIAGHGREHMTARISIPVPALARSAAALPRARVLQPFRRFGTFPPQQQRAMALEEVGETTYVAMTDAYLPPTDRLPIMSWGPRDLSSYGPMRWVGGDRVHCFGDFMFALPRWWSDRYAPGRFLAMGRHRWGDLCGRGPAVFAMNPHADPADSTAPLSTVPMLRYLQQENAAGQGSMPSYSRGGDYYAAAAFLESGPKSAILFAGSKGLGGGWYGTRCGVQGFHDTLGHRAHFIFYNPDDLGRVARGDLAAYLPLPYAGADLNALMMPPNVGPCDDAYVHALAYDRARNLLYGVQKHPGDAQVVHVWKVRDYGPGAPADTPPPPPRDTVSPPPPVLPPDPPAADTCAGLRQAIRDLWGRLEAEQRERADLAAALQATRDSLQAARAWPDSTSLRALLERRLGHPVRSISVGVE